jgi:hypothetical protein
MASLSSTDSLFWIGASDLEGPQSKLRQLCTILVRRRSSWINTVVVAGWSGNVGYGRDLGLALLQNTSVTSLRLWIRGLLDPLLEDTSDHVQPLLNYIAESDVLTTAYFDGGGDHDVLVSRVLDAAAKNANIVDAMVDDSIHPEALARFLTTSRSILKMTVYFRQFGPPHRSAMWAAAFGSNQTLQELMLSALAPDGMRMIELILPELGSNSSKLRVLHLKTGGHTTLSPFQGLARLLSTTQTLCHVGFDDCTFDSETTKALLIALQSNQTVTCLTFKACKIMSQETANLFTEFLQSDRSRIHELHLQPRRQPLVRIGEAGDRNFLDNRLVGITASKMLVRSLITSLTLYEGTSNFVIR